MNLSRDVLEKLGMAIYLHRAMQKTASEALDALAYFRGLGIL